MNYLKLKLHEINGKIKIEKTMLHQQKLKIVEQCSSAPFLLQMIGGGFLFGYLFARKKDSQSLANALFIVDELLRYT
jgi:hypothetical protein